MDRESLSKLPFLAQKRITQLLEADSPKLDLQALSRLELLRYVLARAKTSWVKWQKDDLLEFVITHTEDVDFEESATLPGIQKLADVRVVELLQSKVGSTIDVSSAGEEERSVLEAEYLEEEWFDSDPVLRFCTSVYADMLAGQELCWNTNWNKRSALSCEGLKLRQLWSEETPDERVRRKNRRYNEMPFDIRRASSISFDPLPKRAPEGPSYPPDKTDEELGLNFEIASSSFPGLRRNRTPVAHHYSAPWVFHAPKLYLAAEHFRWVSK